ncbi:glycosyltransferase [Acholeplasma sp. OttesenSCG-928-E16]|nr:glycosyltransferase [Acholeplasma sp. OttesenSCG-928-E16]
MEEKLVSIIIACHNAQTYIDLCLQSLVQQTYHNLEIIICDDASKDKSWEILKKWKKKDPRVIILRNDENLYAAATRNRCIQVSHGDYVMIQDIDDFSSIDRVEKQVKELENDDIDFISSPAYSFSENPNEIMDTIIKKKRSPKKKDFLWNLPFFHPSTMFKRDCILSVGGYRVSPETIRGQDYDMFMRMYALGFKGINGTQPLYYFRLDDANLKRRTWNARKMEMKIRKKGFKALGLMPWAAIFIIKPIFAHFYQKIKYRGLKNEKK